MGEEEPAYTFELGSSLAAVWMLVSLVLFVAAAAGTGHPQHDSLKISLRRLGGRAVWPPHIAARSGVATNHFPPTPWP